MMSGNGRLRGKGRGAAFQNGVWRLYQEWSCNRVLVIKREAADRQMYWFVVMACTCPRKGRGQNMNNVKIDCRSILLCNTIGLHGVYNTSW